MEETLTLMQQLDSYARMAVVITPLALLITWILRRRWLNSQRLPLAALGDGVWRQILLGVATAAVPLALAVLPPLLLGLYSRHAHGWKAFKYEATASEDHPLVLLGFFLVQSLTEEALFRGVALALLGMLLLWVASLVFPVQRYHADNAQGRPDRRPFSAAQWLWSGLAAVGITGIAFAVAHAGNQAVALLPLINVMLAGFWLGWLYWSQGSLYGAWLGHVTWNLLTALLGLPVSGWALANDALGFGLPGAVPGIVSGGAFGPEGSIGCTIGLLLVNVYIVRRTLRELKRIRASEDENWWKELKPEQGAADV